MADPISNLVSQLCRLPGVGTKSAQRLAYFILDMPESEAREIAKAINDARDKIHHCPVCGNYTDTDPCAICRDASRKTGVICVVRDARDVVAMEKMRNSAAHTMCWAGRYPQWMALARTIYA